jgi:oxygen-independent coproporphyrinogen-3 oxidase
MFITSILRVILTRSFKPFIFKKKYLDQLFFQDLENIGLYVHIPFCNSICDFCPYFKVKYDESLSKKYVDTVLKEIDIVCAKQKEKKAVTSLYFGGGTPALILNDLKKIIDKLREYFYIKEGIGIELHPDNISDYTLNMLKATDIDMVSIGIQSFDNKCLDMLGRKNNNFIEKMELVKSHGFSVIDVDLIFGIPKQTEASLIKDIATAFELGATQVSTYPFIDFTFTDNTYKLMKESVKKKMLNNIVKYAFLNNIERTSVWTFSKKGTKKYSSITRDSFLGFGSSATTLLQKIFKINTFSIPDYIKQIDENKIPTSLILDFSKRQRACYFLFWGCYSMRIDSKAFKRMIGESPEKLYGLELWVCRILGLIEKEDNGYRLTDKGAYFYHKIEQVYTTAYIDKSWNISREQAFPEKIILK